MIYFLIDLTTYSQYLSTTLECEMQAKHKALSTWERAKIVTRSKGSTRKVYVIAMVFRKREQILCRTIGANTTDYTPKPLIRKIITQLYIGYLPIGCILYFT